MKRLATALVAAGVLATPTEAQTNINYTALFSPTETVLYLPFAVSVAGNFDIQTWRFPNLHIDPAIWFFEGMCLTGPCAGTPLEHDNNDGWFVNSRINRHLGVGTYTVAMSVWAFTQAEAIAGQAGFDDSYRFLWWRVQPSVCDDHGSWNDCRYDLHIRSRHGRADVVTASVPEPGTMLLVGTGFLGLVGVARRRRDEE